MYEAKLEIPRGGGGGEERSNKKSLPRGDMDIFWNHTLYCGECKHSKLMKLRTTYETRIGQQQRQ